MVHAQVVPARVGVVQGKRERGRAGGTRYGARGAASSAGEGGGSQVVVHADDEGGRLVVLGRGRDDHLAGAGGGCVRRGG